MEHRRALPEGTVTFLFTDIEGSTRLLQHLGDRYLEVLADQRRMLRAARVNACGYGGQILLSQRTRDLVAAALPPGVDLHDMGAHRLKDLLHPEHLFQVMIKGLPTDFPPFAVQPGEDRADAGRRCDGVVALRGKPGPLP